MQPIYPIDRRILKARSKEWMRQAKPPFWQTALIYLLLILVIPDLINLVLPGQDLLDQAVAALANGEAEQANYLFWQALQGRDGLILLFVNVLIALFTLVIQYGYVAYSLGVIRGQSPRWGEIFGQFHQAGKIILAEVLQVIFVTLWSFLLIIPGIIALYRYQMIPYLLIDDPDCSVLEAFRRSKQLMRGRKWELFVLAISFLPWALLASALVTVADLISLPLYLVVLLVCNALFVPYQQYTFCQWYDQVSQALDRPEQEHSQY